MTDRATDDAEHHDAYSWTDPPGTEGQPAEFIDTPVNEPGDQGQETLAEGMRVPPSALHRNPDEIEDEERD